MSEPDEVGGAPALRVRASNGEGVRADGDYVLYWMIAARRTAWSFALDRAAAWARSLERPLIVLEALRCDYPWASDRLHRFVLDGMRDNAAALARSEVRYYPYVEPRLGAGKGLLEALAGRACLVVTDLFPCFFLPRMVAAAGARLPVLLEAVDGNGLLPLAAHEKAYSAAAHYRRHAQALLPEHLAQAPVKTPLGRRALPSRARLPREVLDRWPPATAALLEGDAAALSSLPIDHAVPPSPMHGGPQAAAANLREFVRDLLPGYAERRGVPDLDATSRLSPYLHFGHVSAHQVFGAVAAREQWSPDQLAPAATGAREGWWGMSGDAEAFLDQLVIWRELGYTTCDQEPGTYDRYEALPEWARQTLAEHAADPRPHRYDREGFERARTHDPLWNAAQRQLRQEGWFHNTLRMLWGKKILEWSATPEEALATMIHLMNRWSLDGRDPNSYSGFAWVLGRYDRGWPERPVYGKVRSMSSERTAKKAAVAELLRRYGTPGAGGADEGAE